MQGALVIRLTIEPGRDATSGTVTRLPSVRAVPLACQAVGNLITDRDIVAWRATGRPLAGLLAPRPSFALADRRNAETRRVAMSYYVSKILPRGFDEVVVATTDALKQHGFGIITEIDVKQTFKAKLGIDFRNYRILGACNPSMAHEALGLEDKIGTMLPCNVVVQELDGGHTEVAAIDPVASMQAVDNPRLKEKAAEVGAALRRAVEAL
jgi:uncharacterized protein (DUF302 family)